MDKGERKKLKARALARARTTVGAKGKEVRVEITDKEWEAIQSKAISNTKLREVLRFADIERVRKLSMPREPKLSLTKLAQAQAYLDRGYTYAEVSQRLGMSITSATIEKAKKGE